MLPLFFPCASVRYSIARPSMRVWCCFFFCSVSRLCFFALSPLSFGFLCWSCLDVPPARPRGEGVHFTRPRHRASGEFRYCGILLFLFCSVLSFRCPDSHCVSIGAIPALVSLYASSSTSSSHRYLQGSLATAFPLWLLNMRCAPPVLAVRRLLSLFFYSTIHFQRSTRRLMNAQTHTLLSHSLASLYSLCHASSICGATQKLAARGTCVSCESPRDGNTTAVAVAPAAAATVCIRGLRSNRQNNATTHKTAG